MLHYVHADYEDIPENTENKTGGSETWIFSGISLPNLYLALSSLDVLLPMEQGSLRFVFLILIIFLEPH